MKWNNVNDEIPSTSRDVLLFNNNHITIGYYSKDHRLNDDQTVSTLPRAWEYYNSLTHEDFPVTYWMELPDYPINDELN
jgi:hypothetical protein